MYLFAALGVASFGGIINTDPENPRNDTLQASDFGQVGMPLRETLVRAAVTPLR